MPSKSSRKKLNTSTAANVFSRLLQWCDLQNSIGTKLLFPWNSHSSGRRPTTESYGAGGRKQHQIYWNCPHNLITWRSMANQNSNSNSMILARYQRFEQFESSILNKTDRKRLKPSSTALTKTPAAAPSKTNILSKKSQTFLSLFPIVSKHPTPPLLETPPGPISSPLFQLRLL